MSFPALNVSVPLVCFSCKSNKLNLYNFCRLFLLV